MIYPEEFMKSIKRISIVDLMGKLGISYNRINETIVAKCPKCGKEAIVVRDNKFFCYNCDFGGNALSLLMDRGYSFDDSVRVLGYEYKIEYPQEQKRRMEEEYVNKKERMYQMHKLTTNFYHRKLLSDKTALKYCQSRGLDAATLIRFGIGFADYKNDLFPFLISRGFKIEEIIEAGLAGIGEDGKPYDRFSGRLMFPIPNLDNRVCGFGGRIITNRKDKAKYLNSRETPIFSKSDQMYGQVEMINSIDNFEYLIVCEGYMDVISLHKAGYTNAVASLGTALAKNHGTMLASFGKVIVLCYDADKAGRAAQERAIKVLREADSNVRIMSMTTSPYKDPDEALKNNDFTSLLNKAYFV